MRQKLPESAGYPLMVNDIGETVYPGQEFDAPLLVPGCVSLEPGADEATGGAGSPGAADAGDGAPGADGAAQSATEPPKTRAKGSRQ